MHSPHTRGQPAPIIPLKRSAHRKVLQAFPPVHRPEVQPYRNLPRLIALAMRYVPDLLGPALALLQKNLFLSSEPFFAASPPA